MTIEWVEIGKLKPNPKNPNLHSKAQIDRLAKMIKYQGWRHPIIVSNQSGLVAAGHGRLLAAKKLGLAKVPVHHQDFADSDQEYAFVVSDNAIASWAELDLSAINAELENFDPNFDLELLGLKDFVLEPADKEGLTDEDSVPETPTIPNTKLGDLFLLGEHRLLCGDSTDRTQVERLMGGEKADIVFTDPPYGMRLTRNYAREGGDKITPQGTKAHLNKFTKTIEGDEKDYDPAFILDFFETTPEMFLWGADYFYTRLPQQGSWVVWDKRVTETMDNTFGNGFEICWSKEKHRREICRIVWAGIYGQVGVDAGKRLHPTQKPIRVAEWFFERWGKDAKLIWDGFLGSGSTLIACEKTNRKCYGMEIDPHYCDVIIARWEKFTGKKAVKDGAAA